MIGSDRSGRHRGEIRGRGEAQMETGVRMRYRGIERGRGGTYLSLCSPPDSSQRQPERGREGGKEERERGQRDEQEQRPKERSRGERERKGGSASADYLSTSVINVETRILLGLYVYMCVCGNVMTQANSI